MKQQFLHWVAVATLASTAGLSQAQDLYGGLGLLNIYTLGYAHPMSDSWGVRGEYAGGLSRDFSGTDNGVNYNATLKSSRAGLFGDWFPFGGSFRFVGGITANDTKFDINSASSGTATINGKTVNMAGNYFNVQAKYPAATPYLGIGWGHHAGTGKGLGFYADIGVTFGSFTADVSTNLVGQGGITQADVDKQKQDMNDSLAGYKVLPSFSVGINYRF